MNNTTGMTLIVKVITRLTVGLILIYGIYITLQGHTGPGGGFAGGIIIALSFVHLMLAYGKDTALKKLDKRKGLLCAGTGALIFTATIAWRLIQNGNFLTARDFAARLSLISDIALAAMVGTGLFVIFIALVLLIGEKGK